MLRLSRAYNAYAVREHKTANAIAEHETENGALESGDRFEAKIVIDLRIGKQNIGKKPRFSVFFKAFVSCTIVRS